MTVNVSNTDLQPNENVEESDQHSSLETFNKRTSNFNYEPQLGVPNNSRVMIIGACNINHQLTDRHIDENIHYSNTKENNVNYEPQAASQSTSDDNSMVCNINLENVKVPVIKRRGRPAGSDITVIGLPKRRKKTNGPVPFEKMKAEERANIMLKWILTDVKIVNFKQIELPDLLPMN